MNDGPEPDADARRRRMLWKYWSAALFALLLLFGAAIPASAAELMRVTFVRHGESAGNASGLIDTSTPGPVLTPTGEQQARDVAGTLGDNNYDAIYGSTMVRTQLTAAPMSQYLRLPIQVLPGLQEIEAGIFEGTPESEAEHGYAQAMLAWTFAGQRDVRIPGSINGHEFDARVDAALQTMYDNGDRNPVVFSHGGTIMFWTLMNVQNLTLQQKIELLSTSPLDNTDYVVIEGNPEDGWVLVDWNGRQFSPDLTLAGATRLHVRTLSRQLVGAAQQVVAALATGDIGTIVTAINRGIADAAYSVVKFQRAMVAKVSSELGKVFAPPSTSTVEVSTTESAPDSDALTLASDDDVEDPGALTTATDDGASMVVSDAVPVATGLASAEKVEQAETVEKAEADAEADDLMAFTDGAEAVPTRKPTRPARLADRASETDNEVSELVIPSGEKPGDAETEAGATPGVTGGAEDSAAGDGAGQGSEAA